MGSHLTAAYGGLLLSALMASVEPAFGAQQPSASAPGQTTPADPPAVVNVDKLPVSLDRIREQLDHEPAFSLNLLRALEIPLFRIETRSDPVFKADATWWKDDDVGSYVRPTVNRWHYDFMKMVNPDLPMGYGPGSGVDVLPAIQSAIGGIRHAYQERERVRIRQQIQDELRAIEEARRQAGLPPLELASPEPTSQNPASNTGNANPASNGTSTSPQPTIKVNAPPPHPPDPR